MLSYGYQWPEMFNCSKFPQDNGLCIQSPGDGSQPAQLATTASTETFTPTASFSVPSKKTNTKSKADKTSNAAQQQRKQSPQLVCHGCADNTTVSSMSNIVASYCSSDLVIRGRLSTLKPSRFDLFKQKSFFKQNRTLSQYLSVPRRDRKVLKGAKLNLNSYLAEKSLQTKEAASDADYVEETGDDELDIYLLSNYHLKLAHSLQRNTELKRLRSRSAQSYVQCRCDKLKKAMKHKMKYLLFGKVMRVKKANLKPVDNFGMLRRSRSADEEQQQQQQQPERKHRRNDKHQPHSFVKVIYLNGVYSWHSAKAFIDYIEDDTLSKENMCSDIYATVDEINRVKNLLI